MSTREEVEEWLQKAPKSIQIEAPISMNVDEDQIHTMGHITPFFIKRGYKGEIHFKAKEWN